MLVSMLCLILTTFFFILFILYVTLWDLQKLKLAKSIVEREYGPQGVKGGPRVAGKVGKQGPRGNVGPSRSIYYVEPFVPITHMMHTCTETETNPVDYIDDSFRRIEQDYEHKRGLLKDKLSVLQEKLATNNSIP